MNTETTTGLTKNELAALRQADSICFDHSLNGHTGLRAVKRGKAPFFEEHRVEVPCKSTVYISGDGVDWDTRCGKHAQCFAWIHSAQFNEEWRTIVRLLKPGDEVELRWVGNDDNGYVKRARVTERDESCHDAGLGMGLCHDRLYLKVRRKGKQVYSFYVDDSVCPNNTARMVKPYGY